MGKFSSRVTSATRLQPSLPDWDIKLKEATSKMQILQSVTRPIQELWRESYIALNEIEIPPAASGGDPLRDITNLLIIITLVTLLMLGYRRILEGLSIVGAAMTNNKRLMEIEEQSNLQVCRNTLFQFLSIFTAFVFANIAYATGIIGNSYTLPIRFSIVLGFIVMFFLFRRMALQFMCWVNISPVFKLVRKIGLTYACVWYIIVLFCFFAIKFIPYASMEHMRYCIIFSLLPVMALYFFSIFRIFISKGFSPFFYILYLCTLEILPILVLIYLNFN